LKEAYIPLKELDITVEREREYLNSSLERALHFLKRALQSLRRGLHSLKRARHYRREREKIPPIVLWGGYGQ